MGYTHYWEFDGTHTPKQLDAAIADCNKIVGKAKIPLGDGYGENEPVLKKGTCRFNGVGDEGHEGFTISKEGSNNGFKFCKTAQKPYDPVVVACLIALKKHLGKTVVVSSDGNNKDWDEGRELCQSALGYGGDFILERSE